MTDREKLIELLWKMFDKTFQMCVIESVTDYLLANGVTMQECCHKAESVISNTGLMCTACHSDIDRDAVFCKYCGAKVMPQPQKGEAND